MSKFLFLFTIGPVQSFIAEARKTSDLYAGSKLLSDLTEYAIDEVKDKDQTIVFPDEEIPSKPNRLVAIVETENPKAFGEQVENKVRNEFKTIAETIFLEHLGNMSLKTVFDKQINDFLDIHWIMMHIDNDNYSDVYLKTEKMLGATKGIRAFKQLNGKEGELGRKCSLCGKNNIVSYRLNDNDRKKVRKDGLLSKLFVPEEHINFYTPERESENLKIQKGEGLCAVCFTKRFYNKSSFPSTAEIAAMEWIKKIPDSDKKDYKHLFKNFDEQLYYEENLNKEFLTKYDHFKDKESLRDATTLLKKIYKKENKGKPPKYYALIAADGDNMGKWLSGEFLADKSKLKDFHRKVSKELGNYAKQTKETILPPKGKVIYAGGDDVMLFANLNHLFEILSELKYSFPKFENLGFHIENNHSSTISAGIVIAHYKTPLSEVLRWVRKMEKEAKEEGDRDAFAIAVLKHSGEIQKTIWKWKYGEDNPLTVEHLTNLINKLNDEKEGFSNTFIKNLNIEFERLDEVRDDILKTELKRLLNRSSMIKDKNKKKEKVKEWQDILFNLFINKQTKDNFLSFLNIADFLAREVK